jgi:hypothetical protein
MLKGLKKTEKKEEAPEPNTVRAVVNANQLKEEVVME